MTRTQVGRVLVVAPPAQTSLGIELADGADRPRLWPGLGRVSPPPFVLVLVPDSAGLARVSGGRAPAWGAGIALPTARTIVLRTDLDGLDHTLLHELGHLMLRQATRGRIPLWFDEGYAAWTAGELGRMDALELNLAVASGNVPSFDALDTLLRSNAVQADLAYALAASAVANLAHRKPPAGLDRFFERLAAGDDFDASLVAATGLTRDAYEEDWQRSLRRRYSLVTWLVAGGAWGVVALALGGLLWYRRRYDRPRRVALDQGWVVPEEPVPTIVDSPPGSGAPVDQRGPSH
jgi:peptidase MA superfamily protein